MTSSLIPYSFTPGTKAKAQEVNANFIALAEKIETNAETIEENKSTAAADTAKCAKKNGDETYSGAKTFISPDNGIPIILKHKSATVSPAPSLASNLILDFQDASGTRTGCVYNMISADGGVATHLQAIRGEIYNTLSLNCDSAGKFNITHNGSLLRYVDYMFANEWGWCRKWSDGWLEQGGIIPDFGSYSSIVLTFFRPWLHTGYSIFVIRGGYISDGTRSDFGIISMSTVNCNIGMAPGSLSGLGRWYACGWDSTAQ